MRSLLVLVVLAAPSPALAFDTFAAFSDPVTDGGGGGRYFTGSPADGYTCSVCHFGGEPLEGVRVQITPLTTEFEPLDDGYREGQDYEILVTLPLNTANSAATLELLNVDGEAGGSIALREPAAQAAEDQCTLDFRNPEEGEDLIAAHLATPADPPRQIAGVDNCGAEQLRVTWTAPDTTTGPIWLNVGVVGATDGEQLARPSGDFAWTYGVIIAPFGAAPESGRVESGCAVSPVGGGSGWWLLAVVAVLRRRRVA